MPALNPASQPALQLTMLECDACGTQFDTPAKLARHQQRCPALWGWRYGEESRQEAPRPAAPHEHYVSPSLRGSDGLARDSASAGPDQELREEDGTADVAAGSDGESEDVGLAWLHYADTDVDMDVDIDSERGEPPESAGAHDAPQEDAPGVSYLPAPGEYEPLKLPEDLEAWRARSRDSDDEYLSQLEAGAQFMASLTAAHFDCFVKLRPDIRDDLLDLGRSHRTFHTSLNSIHGQYEVRHAAVPLVSRASDAAEGADANQCTHGLQVLQEEGSTTIIYQTITVLRDMLVHTEQIKPKTLVKLMRDFSEARERSRQARARPHETHPSIHEKLTFSRAKGYSDIAEAVAGKVRPELHARLLLVPVAYSIDGVEMTKGASTTPIHMHLLSPCKAVRTGTPRTVATVESMKARGGLPALQPTRPPPRRVYELSLEAPAGVRDHSGVTGRPEQQRGHPAAAGCRGPAADWRGEVRWGVDDPPRRRESHRLSRLGGAAERHDGQLVHAGRQVVPAVPPG